MPVTSQMRQVRLLTEEVANHIAAGEVVERPASVLKELLENSLDAGAVRIKVEMEGGGRRLIRVVDNGAGMSPDDMLLALERHATSKISTAGDLEAISSLGFRGEAIPSIAAVSRFSMRSRLREAEAGFQVEVAGGSIRDTRDAGCPPGTVVEVRDLFFNIPARRKFLKSPATEGGHLGEALVRLALARPGTAFRYQAGSKLVYDLTATDDLRVRVGAILGREAVSRMRELDLDLGVVRVRGLAGVPSLSRSGPDQIYTFVNGRFVRDKVLLHAVGQAYRGLLLPGRRPVVVLHLSLDPAGVDVNVHPAKVEVRFRRQKEVHDQVAQALRRGLASSGAKEADSATPSPARTSPPPLPPDYRPYTGKGAVGHNVSFPAPSKLESGALLPPSGSGQPVAAVPSAKAPVPVREDIPLLAPGPAAPPVRPLFEAAGGLTVLGQLHGLYVICASPQGLVICDQHAAHERLTYEEMKKGLESGGVPRQGLLIPATLELTPAQAGAAESQAPDWLRLGLEIAPFGGNTWVVSTVPAPLAGQDPAAMVRDLLSELSQAGVPSGTPEFIEVGLRSLACRSSIKSGQRLSSKGLDVLVHRAAALDPPVTCPHGRPVFLRLSARDLAKFFKRSYGGAG